MDFLNNFQIPGAADFLGGLLNNVVVTEFSDDEIRLQYDGLPGVVVVIEGDDFTYQNGTLSGGSFESLEVLLVDKSGDENTLIEVEVNDDQHASIQDVLGGKVGIHVEVGDALTDLIDNGSIPVNGWVADLLNSVLEGDDGDDIINGDDRDNDINGDGGDDDLDGGMGDDDLYGGAGDDMLAGGRDNDFLNGGKGDDDLRGDSGKDELNGGKGDDNLYGGSGKDDLDGGKGDDDLFGGSGNDTVSGGKGDDVLWGNKGRDSFVFGNKFDTDKIKDFVDNVDTIVLNDNLWKGNMSISKMLNKFGEVTNNGVTLDFGGGDILKIAGVDSLSDLRNDIDII